MAQRRDVQFKVEGLYAKKKPVDLPMSSLVGSAYGIPNEAGAYVNVPLPVRVGAFRGRQ